MFGCLESFCRNRVQIPNLPYQDATSAMANSGKNCAVQELEGRFVGEEIASNYWKYEVLRYWAIGATPSNTAMSLFPETSSTTIAEIYTDPPETVVSYMLTCVELSNYSTDSTSHSTLHN